MLTSLFKLFQQLTLWVCVSFILYFYIFILYFSTANLKVDVSLPVSRTVAERIVFLLGYNDSALSPVFIENSSIWISVVLYDYFFQHVNIIRCAQLSSRYLRGRGMNSLNY